MIDWFKRITGFTKPVSLHSTTNDFSIDAKAVTRERSEVYWYRDAERSDTFVVVSSDVLAKDEVIYFFDPTDDGYVQQLSKAEFHNTFKRDPTEAFWDYETQELTY